MQNLPTPASPASSSRRFSCFRRSHRNRLGAPSIVSLNPVVPLLHPPFSLSRIPASIASNNASAFSSPPAAQFLVPTLLVLSLWDMRRRLEAQGSRLRPRPVLLLLSLTVGLVGLRSSSAVMSRRRNQACAHATERASATACPGSAFG